MKDEKPSKLPETTTSQDNPVPTATPTTESRRRLLKRLATGGGVAAAGGMLPTKWASPVVESVLLPAHAAGSPGGGNGGTPPGPSCPDADCSTLDKPTSGTQYQGNTPEGAFSISQSDDCTGSDLLPNNKRLGFVVGNIPEGVTCAYAAFQDVGDDPVNDTAQGGKTVVVSGGVANWNTDPVPAAQGTTQCRQLIVRFGCDTDCQDNPDSGCVVGYVDIEQS